MTKRRSDQQAMLQLPEIWGLVADNSRSIRGHLRLALVDLASGALDTPTLRRRRRELDKLLRMLQEQRNVLETLEAESDAQNLLPPATTHLALYRDAVMKRDFAAASPWFDRYCGSAALQALSLEARGLGFAKKWRGPLNRNP